MVLWRSASLLGSSACVRVHQHEPGGVLMERAIPGVPLAHLVIEQRDDRALAAIADVVMRCGDSPAPAGNARVADFMHTFNGRAAGAVPTPLLSRARHVFEMLVASPGHQRLLHGDLHHANVLDAGARGWLAIDPKGLSGEREYELSAALRNPAGRPDLFASPTIVEHRLGVLTRFAGVDATRTAQWAFVNSVLSAIWCVEDSDARTPDSPALVAASALEQILGI